MLFRWYNTPFVGTQGRHDREQRARILRRWELWDPHRKPAGSRRETLLGAVRRQGLFRFPAPDLHPNAAEDDGHSAHE